VNNFLSRLADRALGQAPLVDPLVRSWYDPASELEARETFTAPLPEPRAESASAPPETAVAPARAVGTVDPAAPAAAPPVPVRVPVEAPPRRGRRGSTLPRAEAPRAGGESDRLPTAEPPAEGRSQRQPVATPPPPRVESPRRRRATGARPSEPPARALGAAEGDADQPDERPGRLQAPPPEPAVAAQRPAAREQPVSAARRRGAHSSPVRPQLASVRAAEAAPAQGRSDSAEPPAVHVTIGRVEVRAPQAPPPPVPPPAPEPRPGLTLDEYLRTRGGVG